MNELTRVATEQWGEGTYAFQPTWWYSPENGAVHVFLIGDQTNDPDKVMALAEYVGNIEKDQVTKDMRSGS